MVALSGHLRVRNGICILVYNILSGISFAAADCYWMIISSDNIPAR